MIRKLILTALLGAVGATCAIAQAGLLPSTVLMREQGQLAYRDLNNMVKGEATFDKAKVEDILAKLSTTAVKIPDAFPETSKGKKSAEARYSASPKVWEQAPDFKSKSDKLKQTVESYRGKIDTLDQLKAAYPAINDSCTSCHETYRLRAS
jgi:cytochrome c556